MARRRATGPLGSDETMVEAALSPAKAFETGRQLQAAGDLDTAKNYYGHVLLKIPHHAEALTMLSSIAYQQGDDTQAEAYVDRAIAIYLHVLSHMPENLNARAPVANLLLARGRIAEAEELIRDLSLPLNPIRATPQAFVARRRSGIERSLPPMLINTLPKSASESIWNRLAEGLQLAQTHLSIGLFPDCCLVPARLKSAAEGGLIAKEHIPATPHNLAELRVNGLNKVVFHVRDPRQAALSWAHFVHDDVSMRLMGPIWRRIVPPAEVLRQPLPELLDWCIAHYLPAEIAFMEGWRQVAEDPDSGIEVLFMTFEHFLREPEDYLNQVIDFYGIDRALFAAQAEAEVVHLRKGETEEWRGVLSEAQQRRAWDQLPPALAEAYGWTR